MEAIPAALMGCGEGVACLVTCLDCGHKREIPYRCDLPLLCRSCRAREIIRKQAQVRGELREIEPQIPHGARAKMLTLTTPHAGELADRIGFVLRGRVRFCRWLRSWCKTSHARPFLAWWSAFELTAGDDFEGHPHVHMLTISHFLPWALLGAAWGASLRAVGAPVLWRTLGPAIDWVNDRGRAALTRREGIRGLFDLAVIPCGSEGQPAPRRRERETAIDFVVRRATWAVLGPTDRIRWRTLAQVAERFDLPERDLIRAAFVPWGIVDVRAARGNGHGAVVELMKYAIKDRGGKERVREPMQAKAFFLLRRRHRFERSETGAIILDKPIPACEACGSARVIFDPTPRAPGPEWSETTDAAIGALLARCASRNRPPPLQALEWSRGR